MGDEEKGRLLGLRERELGKKGVVERGVREGNLRGGRCQVTRECKR
jgi:hypothetical protein